MGSNAEAVAVITGKEMDRGVARRPDLFCDGLDKILIVHEYDVMRRAVHALQETVSAVIDAVQHVGEIIIPVLPDGVFGRGRQHVVCELLGQDQRRLDFLQAEVLCPAVENFAVTRAFRYCGVREFLHYCARPGVITQGFLNVNLIYH